MTDTPATAATFPPPLDQYPVHAGASMVDVLAARLDVFPFNGVATPIFIAAVVHTLTAHRFTALSHHVQHESDRRRRAAGLETAPSVAGELLHFLGEVEVVFGLWAVALVAAMVMWFDWTTAREYLTVSVNFTEAMFVVVVMAIAATQPVVRLAERAVGKLAELGGSTPGAWWLSILITGPVLGSFITEPAAMTICALLLGRQFYARRPRTALKYATLGLFFVNVSIGGTLTHFAAPPVLMVARPFGWDLGFMAGTFGWKACLAIIGATLLYFAVFRTELTELATRSRATRDEQVTAAAEAGEIPGWVVAVHVVFLASTVALAHYPVFFIAGFLFFLGFVQATAPYQAPMDLRAPLLVGFFLAGLVTHGGLQGWWIAPVLGRLTDTPLFIGATLLTAFNDNALITYLATLVPNLDAPLRYAVVAGAVTGGGLTVIANAPNPAGRALLAKYFDGGVSPLKLAAAALPTVVAAAAFLLLRF
ncbi:MAG: putative Na+/H+ antiporter [Vicinamibacterales bacterium]